MKNKLREYKELLQNILNYSDKLASNHIDSYDGENVRDLSDIFRRAGEEMSEDDAKVLNVDSRMLKDTVATLFGAGFATVSGTLNYSILLMALHPDIQLKIQEEIDRVIGKGNFPTMDDSNKMPYTMAVINEIYRYHSLAAFGFTHAATCDTELDGYFIANGTPVMFNFWSAHRDPTVFTNPDKFDPDRFLTPDGKLDTIATENVIAYGLGHRRCAGEVIARMEVIVFFLVLLQRCVIKEAPGHPLDPENYFFNLGVSYFESFQGYI
jgi:cytochrome P450